MPERTLKGGLVEARMAALMRCLLALGALLVSFIDPGGSLRLVTMGAYFLYSIALAATAIRDAPLAAARWQHWIDLTAFASLVALTGGANSMFAQFLFFPILIASFSFGFREGLTVGVTSAVALIAGTGLAAASAGTPFEPIRALVLVGCLLLLGYLIAHCGGRAITGMRRVAQLERSQISRDLHDGTLQPYVGLKLGLEALYRKVPAGGAYREDLKELVEMTALAIDDLRRYAARLRGAEELPPGGDLLSSVQERARRYEALYGLQVTLRSEPGLRLSDRVAGEALQMVSEALSNICRHTKAKRAFVALHRQADSISIEVGNESDPAAPRAPFTPRSITERAAALGGTAEVRINNDGHDVVRVTIPL